MSGRPWARLQMNCRNTTKSKSSFSDDSFKKLTLSGAFNRNNLENILSALCLANGLNYKKVKDGYLIRQDPGS